MENIGFTIDPGEDYILLFITFTQRQQMIIEAEWPAGIETTTERNCWKIHKRHPQFEEMKSCFSNLEAQKVVHDVIYQEERKLAAKFDKEFVEPVDRIHLFITDSHAAKKLSYKFDTARLQWFIPKDHPAASKLKKQFTTIKAKSKWHMKLSQAQKREEQFETTLQNFNYGQDYGGAEIVHPRGPKTGQTPDPRVTLKMFKIRVTKGIIDKTMTKQRAAQIIASDLAKMGTDITPNMVLKQIERVKGTYDSVIKELTALS